MSAPVVIIIGGPNGAGKTTAAPALVRDLFGLSEYVNADTIAAGLSAFDPDRAAFAAGRIMLSRLKELARQRRSFAFETTLASRTFAPWLKSLAADGYEVRLLYFWVPSPELAVQRVAQRVELGGHGVPPEVVRRRLHRSLSNLLNLYVPLMDAWRVYDTTRREPCLIADGRRDLVRVREQAAWKRIAEYWDETR